MITPTPTLLRVLSAVSAALFLVEFFAVLGYLMLSTTTEPETLGMQNTDVAVSELFACFAVVTFVPAYLAGLIGLTFFCNWARWLYAGALATFHTLNLFVSLFNVSTAWGFPAAIAQLEAVICGLILGLAFCSPLSREFVAVDAAVIN